MGFHYIPGSTSGAATYTELDGSVNTAAAIQGAGDGEWIDWDLSGTLPAGTLSVDIIIHKLVASDEVGCRTNGSALVRKFESLKNEELTLPVDVGADRIIEIEANDVSDGDIFQLIGYWV